MPACLLQFLLPHREAEFGAHGHPVPCGTQSMLFKEFCCWRDLDPSLLNLISNPLAPISTPFSDWSFEKSLITWTRTLSHLETFRCSMLDTMMLLRGKRWYFLVHTIMQEEEEEEEASGDDFCSHNQESFLQESLATAAWWGWNPIIQRKNPPWCLIPIHVQAPMRQRSGCMAHNHHPWFVLPKSIPTFMDGPVKNSIIRLAVYVVVHPHNTRPLCNPYGTIMPIWIHG